VAVVGRVGDEHLERLDTAEKQEAVEVVVVEQIDPVVPNVVGYIQASNQDGLLEVL